MNLKQATETTLKVLEGKQDPDKITYIKQWNEFGGLKGWIVTLWWGDVKEAQVSLDITPHYCRVVGDLESMPDFIKGKHQEVTQPNDTN